MTRREQIIEMLEKDEMAAQDLANHFRTELFEILEDLDHIRYSIKPRKLKVKPATCKECGFAFEERSKIKRPSKCPRCRSESIVPPLFSITG